MLYFHAKDRIEKHLERLYPRHVGGYLEGWLDIEAVDGGRNIYTWENGYRELITTILDIEDFGGN